MHFSSLNSPSLHPARPICTHCRERSSQTNAVAFLPAKKTGGRTLYMNCFYSASSRTSDQVVASISRRSVIVPVAAAPPALPSRRRHIDRIVLLDHFHDIVAFDSPLWRRPTVLVHDDRVPESARFSRRGHVPYDSLLTNDPLSSWASARHFGPSPTPSCTSTSRSSSDDRFLFSYRRGADEAGAAAQNPEEPDQEQETSHAPKDDSRDCAGRWACVEAGVLCRYGKNGAILDILAGEQSRGMLDHGLWYLLPRVQDARVCGRKDRHCAVSGLQRQQRARRGSRFLFDRRDNGARWLRSSRGTLRFNVALTAGQGGMVCTVGVWERGPAGARSSAGRGSVQRALSVRRFRSMRRAGSVRWGMSWQGWSAYCERATQ